MADFLVFLGRMVSPSALALVFLGAIAVAWVQAGRRVLRRLPATLRPLLRARPQEDRDAARRAMGRVEHIAQLKGVACADRVTTTGRFLGRAIEELANAGSAAAFERWAGEDLTDRAERHGALIRGWTAIADAAPALGLAGTIVGLIRMFSVMDDPAAIGPAMAMALLTTFYGVLLANMIAGPIATRLEWLSEREIGWQREVIDRMTALARAEMGDEGVTVPPGRQAGVAPARQNPVRQAA